MSARRELLALWTRCDTLRARLGTPGTELDADARRLLGASSEELAAALRRLGSAGMLTATQTRDLEQAHEALVAACDGGLPPATAIARYAFAVQEVAAGLHVALAPPRCAEGNGPSVEVMPASTATVLEALAHAGSLAAGAGHRLSGFAASGKGQRFTARCAGCGGQVSVERRAGVWAFSGVGRCTPVTPLAAPS